MATVTLTHRYLFGLKADVNKSVLYLDDQNIAYVAGHVIVIYSLDEKRQRFLPGTEGTLGITAIAASSGGRNLAVAERNDRAVISIFDIKALKRRKVLSNAEAQTRIYVAVEFSSDNQLLLAQGGDPDWVLYCWDLSKGKLMASITSPLSLGNIINAPQPSPLVANSTSHLSPSLQYRSRGSSVSFGIDPSSSGSGSLISTAIVTACTFNPTDPGLICVTGANLIRFFRLTESTFRPLPGIGTETNNYTCHTWVKQVEHFVVAGTSSGDLILFTSGVFSCSLNASPKTLMKTEPDEPHIGVSSLVSVHKGILCGLDNGTVFMYKIKDGEDITSKQELEKGDLLIPQRRLRVESNLCQIRTIAVPPVEDTILVSTSSGQLYTFPYRIKIDPFLVKTRSQRRKVTFGIKTELIPVNASSLFEDNLVQPGDYESEVTDDEVDYLITPFHSAHDSMNASGSITGLDVCVRKSIIVTCGYDRTVRLWNYIDKSCEIVKKFGEEAYSVALHPSGLHLVVGFADKLRLMTILMDDIRPFREFAIKACRECQFANGGHLFAAVNGNTIQVYNFFSCEVVANLRGHNGKVRCLYWTFDDAYLISAGMDGAVYQWDFEESKREAEFIQKGVPYVSVICNRERSAIYAAGSDKMLKEIEFPSSQLQREFGCGNTLGQIVVSNSQRMFFASTADSDRPGAVRVYEFPLTGDYYELQCSSFPITRLRISFDDTFLFTASEDGIVGIFEIRDKEGRSRSREAQQSMQLGLNNWTTSQSSDEILVTRSDLEDKTSTITELKHKVDELILQNEYQLRLKDMTFHEQLKELNERFAQEITTEKNTFEHFRVEKNNMEIDYEEKIKQLDERHFEEIQETEATYQQEIMKKVEQYQHVLQEKEYQHQRWKQEQMGLITTHQNYVKQVTEDLEERLSEDRLLRAHMEDENKAIDREYHESMQQMESDVDEEIEHFKNRFSDAIQAEREMTLRFKGENGIMKKKFSALQKEIEEQRDQIKQMLEKEKKLNEDIKTMEREIQGLRREIRTRDEAIGDREKRIYELKKKNQELEKFKFVLDYKIKELKLQIEPRENVISGLKNQIEEMDCELESFHKSNTQLDGMIGEQRKQINFIQEEIMKIRKITKRQEIWLQRFHFDLHQCMQYIQKPSHLNKEFDSLYKKYVIENVSNSDLEVKIQQEYTRQKEYLERTMQTLRQTYVEEVITHENDHSRITVQNLNLIKEINQLRSDLSNAKTQLQMEKSAASGSLLLHRRRQKEQFVGRSNTGLKNPQLMITEQSNRIIELRRAVQALEGKLDEIRHSETLFPPIRGVEG